jgi:acetyl-CoA carboxylase carboxyltransferase component
VCVYRAGAAHYTPDNYVLAWPSAESGALPIEGGIAVAFAKEIAAAPDPEKRRKEIETEFYARNSPFPRAEALSVHELIDPAETRVFLCSWIATVQPLLPGLVGEIGFPFRP